MRRDISKLLAEYRKRFYNAPANSRRGQIYINDCYAICDLATKGQSEPDLFEAISIAMECGVMIGYRARELDERDRRRRRAR